MRALGFPPLAGAAKLPQTGEFTLPCRWPSIPFRIAKMSNPPRLKRRTLLAAIGIGLAGLLGAPALIGWRRHRRAEELIARIEAAGGWVTRSYGGPRWLPQWVRDALFELEWGEHVMYIELRNLSDRQLLSDLFQNLDLFSDLLHQ